MSDDNNPLPRLISPNDMQKKAVELMLGGKEPQSRADWTLCANFWAANIAAGCEEAVLLLGLMFKCPLARDELLEIANFQQARKAEAPT